jgi:two-component system KDP operon response regulator KdpE
MAMRVLIVDDEARIRAVVSGTLRRLGLEVFEASCGEEALSLVSFDSYDAVLLDVNMPGMGGLLACRALRKLYPSLGILMLTVRDAENDKVRALDAGADDNVTKPFAVRELVARIKAVVRRSAPADDSEGDSLRVGDMEICAQQRTFLKRGTPIRLTATEFDLLHYLMRNQGKVVTYRKLLSSIWGVDFSDEVQYLRTYMRQLRKKIEDDPAHPRCLLTEPYVGYRFREGSPLPLIASQSSTLVELEASC